jgi:hypothetical protein
MKQNTLISTTEPHLLIMNVLILKYYGVEIEKKMDLKLVIQMIQIKSDGEQIQMVVIINVNL